MGLDPPWPFLFNDTEVHRERPAHLGTSAADVPGRISHGGAHQGAVRIAKATAGAKMCFFPLIRVHVNVI